MSQQSQHENEFFTQDMISNEPSSKRIKKHKPNPNKENSQPEKAYSFQPSNQSTIERDSSASKRNKESSRQQMVPDSLMTRSSNNTREICNTQEENSVPEDKFMNRGIIDYQNLEEGEEETDENLGLEDLSETILAVALQLYKKILPKNSIFIDSTHLKKIFTELFKALQVDHNPDDVQGLINDISDFIPKKLTEQGFIDLFYLTEVNDFLVKHNIFDHSQTARFTETYFNNQPTEEQPQIEEEPSITLETLSLVKKFSIYFSNIFKKKDSITKSYTTDKSYNRS